MNPSDARPPFGGFVGRERETAELVAAFHDACAARTTLFLITGEPGIGKTALAAHLARQLQDLGARVLWGRPWDGGGAPPYWPWVQILRRLVAVYDEESLRARMGRTGMVLTHLVPELASPMKTDAQAPVPSRSERDRLWLFEACATFLASASLDQPLVLIIDDLRAADACSLQLLRYLARDVRPMQVLIIATYRDAMPAETSGSGALVDELAAHARVMHLQGLGPMEVGRLIEQQTGAAQSAETLSAVQRATGGNPLFVRESTRLVTSDQAPGGFGDLHLHIPDSVRAVIRGRLASLSSDAVDVLQAAAVTGLAFDVPLLTHVCGRPVELVLAALSEAVTLGVIAEDPASVPMYRFTHDLVRDVIYDGLPIPVRNGLHERVAEAIEALYGHDLDVHLAELSHHLSIASPPGAHGKLFHYSLRAGERAMARYGYEEAVIQFRRALTNVGGDGDDGAHGDLLIRLGEAQAGMGSYQAARESFLRAAELARTRVDGPQLARAALGFGEPQVEGGIVDRRLVAMLQEALAVLGDDDVILRARTLARLSLELAFSGNAGLQDSSSREALQLARRSDDAVSLSLALRARWMAGWGPEGLDERLALEREMLLLASRTGDVQIELIGRARQVTSSLEAGDIDGAEAGVAQYVRLAGQVQMPFHAWTAATMRAMLASLRGSLDHAEQLAEEALAVNPSRGNVRSAHRNLVTWIRWEQGRLDELRQSWREMVERFPRFGYARGWLCLADAESGDEDAARSGLQSLVYQLRTMNETAERQGAPRDGIWLPALAVASIAAQRMGTREDADVVYRLLLPYEQQAIVVPMPHPVICLGSAALYLGLLAAAMSLDDTDRHFDYALDANTRLGARPFIAHTQHEYANLLLRRARPEDQGRARQMLDQAATTAVGIGMTRLAEQIDGLRPLEERAVGVREIADSGAEPAEAAGTELFRREGEYWTIRYGGSVVRLPNSKGLQCLAQLLTHPGREFHVLDLETAVASPPTRSGRPSTEPELTVRADLGDAGEMLDAQAKQAYRARLRDLQSELDEAEAFNDPVRAAAAREEIDLLTSELARAVGLGGRDRRAASHAERARLNVTRAIRAAMRNIERVNPALGQHLAATIRTGRYCSYNPDPRAPILWST